MLRHWFITGASGGLGRHLVALALAEGDAVVATVRRPNTLSELSKTYGERLMVEPLDVTDQEQVNRVIARCLARGRIDIVVNNAGGGLIGATEEMTDAQVQDQLALNLLAPIQITRAFLKPMREQGGGRSSRFRASAAKSRSPSAVRTTPRNGASKALPKRFVRRSPSLACISPLSSREGCAPHSKPVSNGRPRPPSTGMRPLAGYAGGSKARTTACIPVIRRSWRAPSSTRPCRLSHRSG